MKKHRNIKSGFYKGFETEIRLRQKAVKEAKQLDKPKISISNILFEFTISLFRIIGYFILFLLSSIGLTAIINEPIRKLLINLIQ